VVHPVFNWLKIDFVACSPNKKGRQIVTPEKNFPFPALTFVAF